MLRQWSPGSGAISASPSAAPHWGQTGSPRGPRQSDLHPPGLGPSSGRQDRRCSGGSSRNCPDHTQRGPESAWHFRRRTALRNSLEKSLTLEAAPARSISIGEAKGGVHEIRDRKPEKVRGNHASAALVAPAVAPSLSGSPSLRSSPSSLVRSFLRRSVDGSHGCSRTLRGTRGSASARGTTVQVCSLRCLPHSGRWTGQARSHLRPGKECPQP